MVCLFFLSISECYNFIADSTTGSLWLAIFIFFGSMGFELRALCLQDRPSTAWDTLSVHGLQFLCNNDSYSSISFPLWKIFRNFLLLTFCILILLMNTKASIIWNNLSWKYLSPKILIIVVVPNTENHTNQVWCYPVWCYPLFATVFFFLPPIKFSY
jgi:hypothetical protein